MELSLASRTRLDNGVEMPVLGLGVWLIPSGEETRGAVRDALECGYRLIDTARAYGNERDVGRALRESGLPREEVFVTTKLWNSDHGYEAAHRACRASLGDLGLDYIDLYLIHWPVPGLRRETWKAMAALRDEGVCRAIGVSNYTIRHLDELRDESSAPPAVNQVEFHPFLYQRELLDYCRRRGIAVEAYSPLARGVRLSEPALVSVGRKYGKTPAQVLIRWALQHGTIPIPKSSRPERIRENAAVFDFSLASGDMETLDRLDEGLRVCWDPTAAP
jgi:diketogulonate reductase-like aldo/keto reductase